MEGGTMPGTVSAKSSIGELKRTPSLVETPAATAKLQELSAEDVKESELAGEPIIDKLTRAPGNNAPFGGLKVVTASG
jgi:phosphoglucomutase